MSLRASATRGAFLACVMFAATARAERPRVIVDSTYERTSDGDVVVWASAPSPAGLQEEAANVVLDVGGHEVAASEALPPKAARSAPSLALGVVFIRAKPSAEEVEPGKSESDMVYDGVREALAGNEDTAVYFTPFGSSRPTSTLRGQGSDIDKPEIANSWLYSEPPPPNLIDAVRSNLSELGEKATERIKLLVIVTPGRDVTSAGDPKIAALAKELREARIAVVVVSFRPGAAAREAKAFVDDVVAQVGAVGIDATSNISWTLKSLAAPHGILAFRRFRFPISGVRPLLGGPMKLRIRAGDGAWVALEPPLLLGPRFGILLPLALVLAAAAFAGWYLRVRVPWFAFLDEVHAAVHAKRAPRDAVRSLAARPAQLERFKRTELEALARLPARRYVQFRLPAGKEQLRALQAYARGAAGGDREPVGRAAQAAPPSARSTGGATAPSRKRGIDRLADHGTDPLAAFVAERLSRPGGSARALAVELDYQLADEATRLASWTSAELEQWLDEQSVSVPALAAPAARALVTEARSLLEKYRHPETIAWLVAAGGAVAAGQVFRLKPDSTIVGWGEACDVRLPRVAGVAERHAEISCEAERCVLRRLDGESSVREQAVTQARDVQDGDVVRFGAATFVFKIARS